MATEGPHPQQGPPLRSISEPSSFAAGPPTSGIYILDEHFTGAAGTLPDSAIWTVYNQPGAPNFGYNDEEYYTNNTNILYQDGKSNLIFKIGKLGTYGASSVTWPSGRCDTSASYAVQNNSSCEIRAKLSPLRGAWPAIWFAGRNSQYPDSWTEVDMQESGDPDPNNSHVTIWGPGAANLGEPRGFAVNDGFYHIWRIDYLGSSLKIFVDGDEQYSIANLPSEFSNNGGLYVILNVAVAPGIGYGTPDPGKLPAEVMAVDYVRIWSPAGPRLLPPPPPVGADPDLSLRQPTANWIANPTTANT